VRNCDEMSLFIGREGPKNVFEGHNHRPKTFEKCFVCGADHRPKLLVQFGLYNPDYTWIPETYDYGVDQRETWDFVYGECWFGF